MKRMVRLMFLLFACSILLAPLAGVLHDCEESDDEPCCSAGCVLCLCCAHQPPLASAALSLSDRAAGVPFPAAPKVAAVSDDPRDILHVPIAALSS